MYYEEDNYINLDDNDESIEYTNDILNEFHLDYKMELICHYKNQLINDPDFIGIKNFLKNIFVA